VTSTADLDSDFPSAAGPPFLPPPRPPFDGPEDVRGLPPMLDVPVPADQAPPGPPPRITSWKRVSRVFLGRKVVLVSLIVLGLMIVMTILAPLRAPFSPNELYTATRWRNRALSTGWARTPWAATP
jgi:hypothetical protein